MLSLNSIRPGSTLLLHSSLSRTLRLYQCEPIDILHAVLDRLGPEGTLLLPLFNFDFTKGIPFDIRSTPSHMGALTEIGRMFEGAVRTGHPIYSFTAIGANASVFASVDNVSGYGPDSPFAVLRELDGDIAVLDLPDQNSMTFYHYVEEAHGVSYRFHKHFTAPYTDRNGESATRTYSIFVRDLQRGVVTSVDRMGERLWSKGLYKGDKPKVESGLRIIQARALFDEVSTVIDAGQADEFLYEIRQND